MKIHQYHTVGFVCVSDSLYTVKGKMHQAAKAEFQLDVFQEETVITALSRQHPNTGIR